MDFIMLHRVPLLYSHSVTFLSWANLSQPQIKKLQILTLNHSPRKYLGPAGGNDEQASSFAIPSTLIPANLALSQRGFPSHPIPASPGSASLIPLLFFVFLHSLCHQSILYNILFIASFSPLECKLLESRDCILFIVLNQEGLANSPCSINIQAEQPVEEHGGTVGINSLTKFGVHI